MQLETVLPLRQKPSNVFGPPSEGTVAMATWDLAQAMKSAPDLGWMPGWCLTHAKIYPAASRSWTNDALPWVCAGFWLPHSSISYDVRPVLKGERNMGSCLRAPSTCTGSPFSECSAVSQHTVIAALVAGINEDASQAICRYTNFFLSCKWLLQPAPYLLFSNNCVMD